MKLFSPKIAKITLILGLISVVVLSLNIFVKTNSRSVEENKLEKESPDSEIFEADLLGIGSHQKVRVAQTDNTVEFILLNENQEIAKREFSDGTIRPSSQYTTIKLDDNSSKEFIRWEQNSGPHQTETFIITVHENNFYSIPSGDFRNKVFYEPFWNGRDMLVIGDFDGDGLSEIIEFVDELPPDSPRLKDEELKKITRESFSERDMPELADSAWDILSRENQGKGRGRKVIWGIHTFVSSNPPFFRKLADEEYDRVADIIIKANNSIIENVKDSEMVEIISVNQLTEDSIDFNLFVRNFWTLGFPYELPMDEALN